MSQTDPGPRPIEITIGGFVASGASALLVVAIFDAMGNLRSVDMRASITKAIANSGFTSLSVDQATSIIHGLLLVAGAAAAAAAVLGVFVLQRHRGARIALSVAAVPILFTSFFSQGFLSLLVVTATAMLWSRPARDWFAGRPPAPRPQPVQRTSVPTYRPPVPDVQVRPPQPSAPQPPPSPGWGAPVGPPVAGPPPAYWPPPNPYARVERTSTSSRPREIVVACVVTWIFTSLTAFMVAATAIALAADRAGFLKMMRSSPQWKASYETSLPSTSDAVLAGVIGVGWCLAAAALAFLVWRGVEWAWFLLIGSTVVAAAVCLLALPWSVLMLAVLAFSLGRLVSPRSRLWFASGRAR